MDVETLPPVVPRCQAGLTFRHPSIRNSHMSHDLFRRDSPWHSADGFWRTTGGNRHQFSAAPSIPVGVAVTIVVRPGFRSVTAGPANLSGSTHWIAPMWMPLAPDPNMSALEAWYAILSHCTP